MALAGCQWVLLVIDKHDKASQAAEAENDLLAGEDGVAGAAGTRQVSEVGEVAREEPIPAVGPPAPLTAWPPARCGR